MAIIIHDCPRCKAAHMTFDVSQELIVGRKYNWQRIYELFCVCRGCHKSTTFIACQVKSEHDAFLGQDSALINQGGSIHQFIRIERHLSMRDMVTQKSPEHLPDDIEKCFNEAAACLSIGCWNAAGTMFRLCIDLVTKSKLPVDEAEAEGPNRSVRRSLGLRLPWLFDNNFLPENLRELSSCIKEDGNDGAHSGTLEEADAEDILDFTIALLERLYTEPKKLELASARRAARRN